jgi:hypothetical protein
VGFTNDLMALISEENQKVTICLYYYCDAIQNIQNEIDSKLVKASYKNVDIFSY